MYEENATENVYRTTLDAKLSSEQTTMATDSRCYDVL
jgi:hypothetical protein